MSDSTTASNNQELSEDLKKFAPGTLAPSELEEDTLFPEDVDNPDQDQANTISEDLQNELRELCRKQSEQGRWARRIEVQSRRRNRLYWQGIQRLGWNWGSYMFQIPYGGPSSPIMQGSEAAERPPVSDTTNFYQGYGLTLISVLSQTSPSVMWSPGDPKNAADIRAAATAEKMRKVIERNNCMPDKRIDLCRLFCTDGRVVAYTRNVIDGQKYGFDGTQPKSQEEITFFGVLENRIGLTCNDISQVPCLDLSVEEEVTTLQAMYPECAGKIEPGTAAFGEDEYDRIARLSVRLSEKLQVLAGDTYTHLTTHKRVWLRPSTFASVSDVGRRRELFTKFPKGVKVVYAGTAFCCARNESMDDCLTIIRPLPGDGMDTPALLDSSVSVQDRLNDLYDIWMESYEFALPVTWVNQNTVDLKALQEQRSEHGAHQGMDLPKDGSIAVASQFGVEPGSTVSPDMIELAKELSTTVLQFLTGAQPALFGGNMEDQKTAKGYQMARDQAAGRQGTPWMKMKQAFSSIWFQAVQCAAKHRDDDVILDEGERTSEVSIADLRGQFKCYPVVDEGIPDSWSQRSQKMMQLMSGAATNPVLAAILQEPSNMEMMKNLYGLPDIYIPAVATNEKVLGDIQEMLDSVPIPAPLVMGPMGQPVPSGPPQPSKKLEFYEDPPSEYLVYKQWLMSEEARTSKQTNQDGYMNVYLYAQMLQQTVQKQQQQAMQAAQKNKVSESMAFADMPPSGKLQMAGQAGIQLNPQELAQQQLQPAGGSVQ